MGFVLVVLFFFFYFFSIFLFVLFLFIYLFLALLGLCCSLGFSLVIVSRDYFLVVVSSLLFAVASLFVEYRLLSAWASVVASPAL